MSRKGGAASSLQKDAPWRAASSVKPIPKIHHSPVLRVPQSPASNYALSVMKHPNPIGSGLAMEAIVEAAGPECIVPGQMKPIKLVGVKLLSAAAAFLVKALGCGGIHGISLYNFKTQGFGEVWPIDVNLKFLEPVGRELKSIGKFMDDAVNLMNKSFIDR